MSNKKRFIQAVIARSLPTVDKRQAALDYAEELWAWLTQNGYGDTLKGIDDKPREGKNWYADLTERQRRWFDAFWLAFNYKKGRNEAAMRWAQLGDKTDAEYQQIIDAADKEAKRERPKDQARKEAQGWLHALRYLDYTPTKTGVNNENNHVLQRLHNELIGLKRLYEAGKDPAVREQVKKLEQALIAARKKHEHEA